MRAHEIVTVTVLCLVMSMTASAQMTLTENFDGGQPQNWQLHDGASLVQQPRMGNVLQFQPNGFAAWDVTTGQTFTLQFSAVVQQDSMAGVIFRNSGEPPNHSEYQLLYEGGQLRLIKIANGQDSDLGATPVEVMPNTWMTIQVAVNGGQMTVTVDGQQMLSATDQQPLGQGGLALHGHNVAFDNFTLTGASIPMQTISGTTGGVGGGGGGGVPPESGGGGVDMSSAFGNILVPKGASGVWLWLAGVTGDVTTQGFAGWIDCSDYEFEVKPGQINNPDYHTLRILKKVDMATPRLLEMCALSKQVQAGRLIAANNGRIIFEMRMRSPVSIMSVGRTATDGLDLMNPTPYECLTLRTDQVEWRVPTYDNAGKEKGVTVGHYKSGG